MAGEPDYKPGQIAISPLFLLISLTSVKTTIQGLLMGGKPSVVRSKAYNEGMVLFGMLGVGIVLSAVVICPTLVWTTALSWSSSRLLFGADVIASMLTVFLLFWRPLAVGLRRSYVPRGLYLHECAGAFNIM